MPRWLRLVLIAVAVGCIVLFGVLGGGVAYIASSMPGSMGPRVPVSDGVVGVETGGSYAWIVPAPGGVVLVDTGIDPEATALLSELQAQGFSASDVHTVLLTHAHGDHVGGLSAFPDATLIHGPGEGPLLRGEAAGTLGPIPSLASGLMPQAVLPASVREAADGELVDLGGLQARVVATPGHTLGSTSYVIGDVVFVGDAIFAGEGAAMISPWFLNSDDDLARSAARRLDPLSAEWVADGHAGAAKGAASVLDGLR